MSDTSITNASTPLQPTYFQKNAVTFWTGAAVISLALCLISLGVCTAAAGTSPHWYYQMGAFGSSTEYPLIDDIPPEIKNAWDIQNALQYGAQVGGIALIPCAIGGALFVLSMIARRRAMKNSPASPTSEIGANKSTTEIKAELWAERGKLACLILGFSIATFSVGLMIGSSLILNNGVPHVEQLIQQGMHDYPNAKAYDWLWNPGWTDPVTHHSYGYWYVGVGHNNFWNQLKYEWLDPTRNIMSGIVPVSVVGALGGAGLTAFGIFGKGAFNFVSAIYNKFRSHESENDKMISNPEGML